MVAYDRMEGLKFPALPMSLSPLAFSEYEGHDISQHLVGMSEVHPMRRFLVYLDFSLFSELRNQIRRRFCGIAWKEEPGLERREHDGSRHEMTYSGHCPHE